MGFVPFTRAIYFTKRTPMFVAFLQKCVVIPSKLLLDQASHALLGPAKGRLELWISIRTPGVSSDSILDLEVDQI